ncbi:NAD-dependent SIR2 family protein deacetylase [Aeromicrobium panaciterrae]|uniref:protein acetyllysine N-acetyltransferase n=1 Tax=Aeromicrobium panaciterrae TaxID=363861 RepID=A0ABU1UK64_9ACTN|nr:NAD-dependent protein deacetylase [Aeromicrobium panaciterrae]MDR7085574.1 NAD-dependent SIR2 family protein deacetylase [Aeromicrobium panaciterrae]
MEDVLGDRRLLVLTGAGMSTDSGIPDYRGPGAPARMPMTFQDFIKGPAAQQRYWARAHIGWSRMRRAEPNAGHRLLAQMDRDGRLDGLITQNVDGLHGRAGHPGVIDLHGRIDRVICLDCRSVSSRGDLHQRLLVLNPGFDQIDAVMAPDGDVLLEETDTFNVAPCAACGGRLKPDVVFFGENVPKDRVAECYELVENAQALVVLGSSLQVMSGLRFVRAAKARGIPIVIVNRGTTRGDDLATIKLDAGCAETLTEWARDRAESFSQT